MHVYEEIKDMLCEELERFAEKGSVDNDMDLDRINKLTHSIKSLETIIAMNEAGYSDSYRAGRSGTRARYNRGTYSARGDNRGRGSNARRDSMGRYADTWNDGKEDMMDILEEMEHSAVDPIMRQKIRKVRDELEKM